MSCHRLSLIPLIVPLPTRFPSPHVSNLPRAYTYVYHQSERLCTRQQLIYIRGCACDIPSVTYQYTWAPAVWQKYYSEAPEIFAYFKNVVDEHKLWEYIKLKHRVDHAEWNPEVGQWTLLITDLEKDTQFEDHCDVFVNAMGFLK